MTRPGTRLTVCHTGQRGMGWESGMERMERGKRYVSEMVLRVYKMRRMKRLVNSDML